MKRIITHIILGYWLLFFVLHAMGALAGTLTFATISAISGAAAISNSGGAAMRAMPLVSAGMGLASLLVATLFFWAFLTSLFEHNADERDGEVEKIAFGGAGLVFMMLSVLAVVDADPSTLVVAMTYFIALILSWAVTRVEQFEGVINTEHLSRNPKEEPESVTIARTMASSVAHHNLLAKIAGRERN